MINGKQHTKYFLLVFLLYFCMAPIPVNAEEEVINGDFNDGSSGWTVDPYCSFNWDDGLNNVENGVYIVCQDGLRTNASILQNVDFTYVNNLTFYSCDYSANCVGALVSIGGVDVPFIQSGSWHYSNLDVSSFTGIQVLKFESLDYLSGTQTRTKFDKISAISTPPPPLSDNIVFNPNVSISNKTQQYFNYSVNSTWDGYMYFVTSVWHAPYNLSDLYLIENWLNVEQEGENIQLNNPFNDLQTYHLNLYATTSAPPVVSESFLIASSNEIYINRSYTGSIPPIPDPEPDPDPYDPDPNPIEDPNTTIPDDWNMTIPDKYQNVSWLTNYTGYFDDLTYSVNNTLYSVTGLVIKPMQSLNETVHILRYHISNSKNMVAEYSYLSVIVYYGWGVLPVEMQTIFIGVAAAGACIYLFKRRT